MHFDLICIEGNIGIGKTTLVGKLSEALGIQAFYEEFEENELLPLFYSDPKKYARELELSFLNARAKQLQKIHQLHAGKKLISDYCLDKCLLFAKENLADPDLKNYVEEHSRTVASSPAPSLVIVLHSELESITKNIALRNRPYEQKIGHSYLQKLNDSYKDFFSKERPYAILNIFTPQLNEESYERIYKEILAFIKMSPEFKITTLYL